MYLVSHKFNLFLAKRKYNHHCANFITQFGFFVSVMNPLETVMNSAWLWSYFLGGFVRYMRRAQSYRHSSKNLTWSIFSEILPVRFKLTNSNNRNGIFTKNPSCFWNHTHTNVLSIQLILTPGFSYLQTVTQETNHLLVLKRSVSEVWMKRSGEWQIHLHLAVFFLRHGTSFWWFYLLDDPFLAQSFLFDPLFVEAFDL